MIRIIKKTLENIKTNNRRSPERVLYMRSGGLMYNLRKRQNKSNIVNYLKVTPSRSPYSRLVTLISRLFFIEKTSKYFFLAIRHYGNLYTIIYFLFFSVSCSVRT